jgi:hypothetical protein
MTDQTGRITRRKALQVLAALGVTGATAEAILGQAQTISPQVLHTATALLDQGYAPERLAVIAPALERNLVQYRMLRELKIDDLVEPAPIFDARWR